jgi:hypothetical protein
MSDDSEKRSKPIVVGVRGAVDAERARRLAELRTAGETREIVFGHKADDGSVVGVIVTGVPRTGTDDGYEIPTSKISHPSMRPLRPEKRSTIVVPLAGAGWR